MLVEKYERWFMVATLVFLLIAAVFLIISVVGHHAALPEPAGRIEPEQVTSTPPFDDPGLHQNDDGTYDLVYVAQAWSFTPNEVTVPAGAEIHLIATTTDVIHGMKVPDTNVNAMVIPGQITEVDITFNEPGVYSLLCHEYCGIGHHNMFALINVEEG